MTVNANPQFPLSLTVEQILQQAVDHYRAGRYWVAEALYRGILQGQPGHAEANHNLGVLLRQRDGAAGGALEYLKRALEADPSQGQYWLSYIDVLLEAGQPDAAWQVLAQGRARGLAGPQVEELASKLGGGLGAGAGAGPTRAEVDQVVGLFGQGRYADVEPLARALTQRYARHGFGWKVLGAVLKQLGRDEQALAPMQTAAALLPKDFEAHHNLGLALADTGRLSEAEASYRRALELKPEFAEAHYDLGNALKRQGRLSEAEASFRQAVRIRPKFALAHYNLGNTLAEQGHPEQAEASLRRALELEPELAEAHGNLGSVLRTQGRLPQAEASYLRAVELKPEFADAYANLGAILYDLGRLPEAASHCRRALEIDANHATAHCNLGNILAQQEQLAEAEKSYNRALELRPDFAEALSNLAAALQDMGRFSEAEARCRQALELDPDFAEAYGNLGNVLGEMERHGEAEACQRRALELRPHSAKAHYNLGNSLVDPARMFEVIACYRRALVLDPDFVKGWSNLFFVLNFDPERGIEEIYELHRQYDERFGVPLRAVWREHGNSREAGRRLKVGYVSPDFCRHAVGNFLEPLLAAHDKAVVEVYAYAEVKREDAVTARHKGYVDHWVPTVGLSDEALAERIRADGIDILVDLAGHTAGNRLGVFARKPAPIQITYLGYPGSSGLSAMDYRLSDGYADPEGSQAYYTEKLLRLPDCLCCYRPGEDMPEITVLPAQQNGYVTFGSFNNFNKINSQCIELWARLLQAVPNARLLMVTIPDGQSRQRLAEQFIALGVSAERIEFHGRFSGVEFYRMIQRADIALDPFPVTGGTTTCETLWMGVPVIVLVGNRYISRVGYSFLSAAGFSEFAGATAEAYIDIATQLARDIPRLAEIRARMRPQVAASPLVDEVRFARNLEKVYRQVWTEWCNAGT